MKPRIIFDENGAYTPSPIHDGEELGIGQYRFAHNYELIGKTLEIETAEKTYTVHFECGSWAQFEGAKVEYEAQKLEKAMYFVRLGYEGMALDLDNGQAVLAIGNRLIPGAIKGTGAAAPAFTTDDMVGTKVSWVLGVDRYVTQNFTSDDRMSVAWAPQADKWDEVSYAAVKLRDSFYFVLAESGTLKNTCAPFYTERVLLLEDYERLMTVGEVTGKGFEPICVAGYARF